MDMEESSATSNALSIFSPMHGSQLSSYSKSESMGGQFTQNEVLLIERIYQTASELSRLEEEYSLSLKNTRTRSQQFSQSTNEDYIDILNKKENYIQNLTDAVLDASSSNDLLGYELHDYKELSVLLKNRYKESLQNINTIKEQIQKLEYESKPLNSIINLFNEVNEDKNNPYDQEYLKIKDMFQEAKSDMDKVLDTLYPEGTVKKEFTTIMAKLMTEYVSNLDNVEKQFVQIPHSVLRKEGLIDLRRAKIILQHATNRNNFRLSIED